MQLLLLQLNMDLTNLRPIFKTFRRGISLVLIPVYITWEIASVTWLLCPNIDSNHVYISAFEKYYLALCPQLCVCVGFSFFFLCERQRHKSQPQTDTDTHSRTLAHSLTEKDSSRTRRETDTQTLERVSVVAVG